MGIVSDENCLVVPKIPALMEFHNRNEKSVLAQWWDWISSLWQQQAGFIYLILV